MDTPHAEPDSERAAAPAEPWWRVGMVWLVIGGPLVVVVAAVATLVIALRHPDPVLTVPAADSALRMPAGQGRSPAANPPRPATAAAGEPR